ncbi:MAG: NAD-glutamate dehydrogenase domain-containing protein, partial [Pseudomonadota bacterium]
FLTKNIMHKDTVYYEKEQVVIYKVLFEKHQEIFVFGKYCKGIHVKCAKYSRGGIRISNRHDYIDECRQLAFSQHKKNVCIVPGGSKGVVLINDFMQYEGIDSNNCDGDHDVSSNSHDDCNSVKYDNNKILSVKLDQNLSHDQLHREAYMEFIQALLDVDDHIFVAPDVGTAEFSDLANQISVNSYHWAGEAFATGSRTTGLSHKAMGITSKGGYEVLKTYGFDLYENLCFTAIGIGGMAGDVFGNFMVLSKNIRLIAAFDHECIFIDPHPDVIESYNERVRLHRMDAPSWLHYSKLSSGGMIYKRADKEVKLTYAIRNLIGYKDVNISTDLLIKKILQLHVDVMISGGVGTYIVGKNEAVDVKNKNLQCLPNEINVSYIIEMGNLTITEQALSYLNAKVLTSRIDSSAGVICSDFEVNIKLLSPDIMVNKYVDFVEKMTLLHMHHKSMTVYARYNNISVVDRYYDLMCMLNTEIARNITNFNNYDKIVFACFPDELHDAYYHNILNHKFFTDIVVSFLSNMITYIVGLDDLEKLLNRVSITAICNFIINNYEVYLTYFNQRVYDIDVYREEQYKNYLILLASGEV